MTKIKIGLFGFGVVGQGIYEVVRKSKNAHAEIVKICVRDPKKPRKIEVDPSLFTTSVDDILDNQNINLVVEVIDDAEREALSHLKDTPRSMGFCHAYWSRLSDALSDRGIDWRSPALMNPRCMFD